MIILKWVLWKEWEGVDWIQLAEDSRMADSFKHSNELSISIKGREFTD
jgi:hypothetical protein